MSRVEPIIYLEVNLRHETSGRAFLCTLKNSKTKPPSFFAQHVRSLVICSDVGTQLVVEILSFCHGIVNFSYWAAPSPPGRKPLNSSFLSILDRGADHSGFLNKVAPQRMSVYLHENHLYPLKPHFNLAFFSSVTHLSILNSWEEWTMWTHICSDTMPALTHIKFDMNVQRSRPSRPSNVGIQKFQSPELYFTKTLDNWDEPEILTTSGFLWLDVKLSKVANTLTEVLNTSRSLRVCILLLRFDADPTYTARFITRLASQKFLGDRVPAKTTDVCAANWFDARLVFAHEREPFRYTHASSEHEMKLWKSAETVVDSQRYVTGNSIFWVYST